MTPETNLEYFETVSKFQSSLASAGLEDAARLIEDGLGCINGLTDGWAIFFESLKHVRSSFGSFLSNEQCQELNRLSAVATKVVHRA